jgi:N utilization substance protein B
MNRDNKSVRRRIVREKVMQALYAHEITKDGAEHVVKHVLVGLHNNKDAYKFARELVIATIDHTIEIDKVIKTKVANWDFRRIATIDRLILRMAICEFLYFEDIPPKVTMNEAIELAKLFSTERSGQFVNGILDSVQEDLKTSGEYAKAGRGLSEGAGPRANKHAKAIVTDKPANAT